MVVMDIIDYSIIVNLFIQFGSFKTAILNAGKTYR